MTQNGHIHEPTCISLADCPIGVAHRITRVLDQEPQFLQFVERQGLKPGSTVTVEKRETAAEAVKIRGALEEAVSLGLAAAAKILVEAPMQRKPARSRSSRSGRESARARR